jgi:hypothetical protein
MAEFRYQLRRFLHFSETASERMGVGAQQYQLMQVIAAMPEGQEASISYLAERMVLRHNSMVELVDRAERAGLTMTAEGDAILQRLIEEHLRELPARVEDLIEALLALRGVLSPAGAAKARDEAGV